MCPVGVLITRQFKLFTPEEWYLDPITITIDLSELILPLGVIRKFLFVTWKIELLIAGANSLIV